MSAFEHILGLNGLADNVAGPTHIWFFVILQYFCLDLKVRTQKFGSLLNFERLIFTVLKVYQSSFDKFCASSYSAFPGINGIFRMCLEFEHSAQVLQVIPSISYEEVVFVLFCCICKYYENRPVC
jgi:hypothetical protein